MSSAQLPKWINESTILRAVQSYKNDKTIEIVEIINKIAVEIGENYLSDLIRSTVKYRSSKIDSIQNLYIIIKCEGESGAKEAVAKEVNVFIQEVSIYTEILPRLHDILGGSYVAPDCLLAELKPLGFIILEDLAPLGYRMADRHKGVDMDHSFMVLTKLAMLHASSAVLYEKDSHSMDRYSAGLFTNQHKNKVIEQFVVSGFHSLINATQGWPGYEKYGRKLAVFMDEIFKKSMDVGMRKPEQFNVLNHGDCWTNNILFQYDSAGHVIDTKFVDFQFPVFTSPAVDLQYFICTSLQPEIVRKNLDKLLRYYHERLTATLRKLNYPNEKIPSYKQIYDDFMDRGFYAVVSSAVALPLIKAAKRIDATYDEFTNEIETEFRKSCFATEAYKKILQQHLPMFDEYGYLG